MKNVFLLAFVFGAVIFTSIQAKEEIAKYEASKRTMAHLSKDKNTTKYKVMGSGNFVR